MGKTLEFLDFRRPGNQMQPSFMRQLVNYEQRLQQKSPHHPWSTNWSQDPTDAQVLTALISVRSDSAEVSVETRSMPGSLMDKSSFPMDATIMQLEAKMRSSLKFVAEVSFLTDDGTCVNKTDYLRSHRRLSVQAAILSIPRKGFSPILT